MFVTELLRPSFPIQDVNFLSKFNSQVMWNLLFEPLIGNFKSDGKFLIWFFFLWHLISCQTLKSRPKIMVWKKNQIIDRKIKSCQIDLIWNLLLDLTWFLFPVFDVKSFWMLIFMWQRKRASLQSINWPINNFKESQCVLFDWEKQLNIVYLQDKQKTIPLCIMTPSWKEWRQKNQP